LNPVCLQFGRSVQPVIAALLAALSRSCLPASGGDDTLGIAAARRANRSEGAILSSFGVYSIPAREPPSRRDSPRHVDCNVQCRAAGADRKQKIKESVTMLKTSLKGIVRNSSVALTVVASLSLMSIGCGGDFDAEGEDIADEIDGIVEVPVAEAEQKFVRPME
jgi:hypothetical protein